MAIHEIASDSNSDTVYIVNTDDWSCTCPHYQYRLKDANAADGKKRPCKHLRAAVENEGRAGNE